MKRSAGGRRPAPLDVFPGRHRVSPVPAPEITNSTPFRYEQVWVADEQGAHVLVSIVKATYEIQGQRLAVAAEQAPLDLLGTFWGDPAQSSYKYEPETAFTKLATDVVLIGHARPPTVGATTADVGLKVGSLQKIARVFGDRYWVKSGGSIVASKPQPIERMPLIYERAFGGWDKSSKDERDWRCDARNPVGRGFGNPLRYVEEGRVPLANIEDPNHPIRYGETSPPAGFGFLSPHWQPRAKLAGTYDAAWDKERKPLLPKDFDRRFFNAASPGLIAPGYLRGNEDIVVVNAAAVTPLRFNLPGVPAPICRVVLRKGELEQTTSLDTVIINTDEMRVFLLWRAFSIVRNGPHDVVATEVATDRKLLQPANA